MSEDECPCSASCDPEDYKTRTMLYPDEANHNLYFNRLDHPNSIDRSIECVMCDKTWSEFDPNNVIIHHRDDHQGNLMFCSIEELEMMVEKID